MFWGAVVSYYFLFCYFISDSSESLDRVGRRESYLKSNFESLGQQQDGRDSLDMTVTSGEDKLGNLSSLTSKFLTKTNSNADMISAVKATQRDPEAARKREELQRRIEETRRKLQSVWSLFSDLIPVIQTNQQTCKGLLLTLSFFA